MSSPNDAIYYSVYMSLPESVDRDRLHHVLKEEAVGRVLCKPSHYMLVDAMVDSLLSGTMHTTTVDDLGLKDVIISDSDAYVLVDNIYEAVMGSIHSTITIVQAYKSKKVVNDSVVYEYDDKGLARRLNKKRNAIRTLNKNLNRIRKRYTKDLSADNRYTRYSALAIAIIDEIYERVGDRSNVGTGVTSFKKKHVTISGSKVRFKYIGKSGVRQDKTIENLSIAKAMKEMLKDKKPGGFIFDFVDEGKPASISSKEVNEYLSEFNVTAKDIRGHAANRLLYDQLKIIRNGKLPSDDDDRKRKLKEELKEAIAIVAEKVGHEPGTCKSQYIMPEIIESFLIEGKVQKVASIDDILMKDAADIISGADNLIVYAGFKDWLKDFLNKVVPDKVKNIFKPKDSEEEPIEEVDDTEMPSRTDTEEEAVEDEPVDDMVELEEETDSVDSEIDLPYNTDEVVILVKNVVGGTEEHCDDCLNATDLGLIPITDMLKHWGFPGSRRCRHNCDCSLITDEGRRYDGPLVSKHAKVKKLVKEKDKKNEGIGVFRQNFDLGMSTRAPSDDDDEYNATSIPDDRSNNTGHL